MKFSVALAAALLVCFVETIKAVPAGHGHYPVAYVRSQDAAHYDDSDLPAKRTSYKHTDMTATDVDMALPAMDTEDEEDLEFETKPIKKNRKVTKETVSESRKPCCGHKSSKEQDSVSASEEESDMDMDDMDMDVNPKNSTLDDIHDDFMFPFPMDDETNNTVYALKMTLEDSECADSCVDYDELVWQCIFVSELNSTDLKSLNLTNATSKMRLSVDDRFSTFAKQCQCNKESLAAFDKCFKCVSEAENTTYPVSDAIDGQCKSSKSSKDFAEKYEDIMAKAVSGNLTTKEAGSSTQKMANLAFAVATTIFVSVFVF